MKSTLSTLFAFLILNQILAIGHYEKGDTLNVWAANGLRMRELPNSKSKVISTIIYGESVVVIDDPLFQNHFSVFEAPKFKLKGFWVKVQAGEREGFVFDGYLGRLPVLRLTESNKFGIWHESAEVWAKREFGFKKKPVVKSEGSGDFFEKSMTFTTSNNIKIGDYSSDKGYSTSVFLPNVSMEEAYLFCLSYFNTANHEDFMIESIEKNEMGLFFNGLCTVQIIKQGTGYSIDCSCSC